MTVYDKVPLMLLISVSSSLCEVLFITPFSDLFMSQTVII